MQYQSVELQIASEVTQAYCKYQIACRQIEQFNAGLMYEAKMILEKKAYSYERGETDLLELLNAQRTYNDVQMNYNETLYNCATALVELQRACGRLEN
jgi:cobalt-zinc-cadmium efflux system outer membrane protein